MMRLTLAVLAVVIGRSQAQLPAQCLADPVSQILGMTEDPTKSEVGTGPYFGPGLFPPSAPQSPVAAPFSPPSSPSSPTSPSASGPTSSGPTAGGPTAGGPTAGGPTAGGPTSGGPTSPSSPTTLLSTPSAPAGTPSAPTAPTPCPGDIVAHTQSTDLYTYNTMPITILERDTLTVTFEISNGFKDSTISWIATVYENLDGNWVCPKVESFDDPVTYTAKCVDGYATVTIYVHDGSYQNAPANVIAPSACSGSGFSKDLGKKVMYPFTIACTMSPDCIAANENVPTWSPVTSPPTKEPTTLAPTPKLTNKPTSAPSKTPTPAPTKQPSTSPTATPSSSPTDSPTATPTKAPTKAPTDAPTKKPTEPPTAEPGEPTKEPTLPPTKLPTGSPSKSPTKAPTEAPTGSPTKSPTKTPTEAPTKVPTKTPTTAPTKNPTEAPVQPVSLASITKAPTAGEPCVCGDKTNFVEGDGFVTGGGWVYLDQNARYRGEPIPQDANRANFGFNAMFRGGVPRGSTNFVFNGGKYFHFHSTTGGNAQYDFLEIPNGVQARWAGTGWLKEGSGKPKSPTEEQNGYSFYVAVQDWGEPGADDTWRIKIWETGNPSNVILDTDPEYSTEHGHPTRFDGTTLGELTKNGGGNIQLHRKGVTPPLVLPGNKKCNCKDTPAQGDGRAFVTGGGWINVGPTAIWNTDAGTKLVIPEGSRANYGFNAKWTPQGYPDGSTNFVFEGGANFHFHSTTGGGSEYDFLEVPTPVDARWCGTGSVATGLKPLNRDFKDGYSFCVAVHDYGEPGADDTWHIKIWKGQVVIFDTNPEWAIEQNGGAPYEWPSNPMRFEGTEVGEDNANGGGNIQIHWKGGPPSP